MRNFPSTCITYSENKGNCDSVFHITIVDIQFLTQMALDGSQLRLRMEDTQGNLQKRSLSNKDRAADLNTKNR